MKLMQRFDLRAWADMRAQWQASRVLRAGVFATLGLLCLEGLLRVADVSKDLQVQADRLAERNAVLQADLRQQDWLQRRDDANQQLVALRNMLWNEPDAALAQARVQDWLRTTAAKSQLPLRELSVARNAAVDAQVASPGAAAASSASLLAGEDVQMLHVRLSAEFKRLALLSFLAELAASEDVVVVERLNIRLTQKPATAEMDLRMLSGPVEARR